MIDANGCAGTDQVVVTVNQAIDDDNQSKNETPGFDMALFPNPASEFVTVSFVSENEEVAPINIFDMSGKLVQSMPLEMAIGQNSLHLEIAHLPAGTYQVELRTAPQTQTQKLVIAD